MMDRKSRERGRRAVSGWGCLVRRVDARGGSGGRGVEGGGVLVGEGYGRDGDDNCGRVEN